MEILKSWNVIGGVALALFVAYVIASSSRKSRWSYTATTIMTKNEIEFFHRLIQAFPSHHVFPQVAMSALITPKFRGNRSQASFWKISQKRVDYVICNQAMRTLAIVELDDRTHNVHNDARRDALTKSAGIKTYRFESKNRPNVARLREVMSSIT